MFIVYVNWNLSLLDLTVQTLFVFGGRLIDQNSFQKNLETEVGHLMILCFGYFAKKRRKSFSSLDFANLFWESSSSEDDFVSEVSDLYSMYVSCRFFESCSST